MIDFSKYIVEKNLDDLDRMLDTDSKETKDILKLLREKQYVFLTGCAGAGKTYQTNAVLRHFNLPIITASTGAAALHVKGDTIHRAMRLGLASNIKELKLFDERSLNRIAQQYGVDSSAAERIYYSKLKKILQNTGIIVIDEISMLSAAHIDMLFYRLEQFKQYTQNIPILAVGDFLQLPPVNGKYAFESENWGKFVPYVLTEVKRTTDEEFIYVQNKVRMGKYTQIVKDFVEEHTVDYFPDEASHLFSLKESVEAMNTMKLRQLETESQVYEGQFIMAPSSAKEADRFLKNLVCPSRLEVKIGCRVMFTANINDAPAVNGELGTVVGFTTQDKYPIVLKDNGVKVEAQPFVFEQYKVDVDPVTDKPKMVVEIQYSQIPLVVAYAITIHKSQGATLDSVAIDCEGIFEVSQFYVALSRAKNPEKLYIKNFKRGVLKVSNKVLKYYEGLQEQTVDDTSNNTEQITQVSPETN